MQEVLSPESAKDSHPLPISKLRGLPPDVRSKLKAQRITTCPQLLMAAGKAEDRQALAETARIDPGILLRLACRADIARINGIGSVFSAMLEALNIVDLGALARSNAGELHEALRAFNRAERFARRSPTPEEVADWVATARRLPIMLTYDSLTHDGGSRFRAEEGGASTSLTVINGTKEPAEGG